jgi:type 1 fimbriae regulatory protein FimB
MTVPSLRCNGTVTAKQARQTATHRPTGTPASNAENGTNRFRPRRLTNEERRPREHLSRDEVLALCKATRRNCNGTRDAAAIWIAFNHGLRVSELCGLRWHDIQWQERRIMVRRLKGSQSGERPLTEQDKRFLGPLRQARLRPSDRVVGMEPAAFRRMLYRLKLPPELATLKPHPHMLRHACGFDLVGRADLQAPAAFMGHKRLENTVRYSKLAPEQFEGLRP